MIDIVFRVSDEAKKIITDKDFDDIKTDVERKYPKFIRCVVKVDIEDGFLGYTLELSKIKRIRRITGYLVGETSSWNDAKLNELKERVKHES